MQGIYYPGFTRAGIGEPVAILMLVLLLFLTPAGPRFWLTLGALAAMCAMHAIFSIYTQPANRVWVRDLDLGRADAAFFRPEAGGPDGSDWTELRDRWESSMSARAACAGLAFVLLAVAMAL